MVVIDVVHASILIIQKLVEIRNQIEYNKQQCYRLIDRLSSIVPMILDWQKRHSDSLASHSSYHSKTFLKFYHFLQETDNFIHKFLDRTYFTKVFSRNIDSDMFFEINNDLSQYINELQLGVLFDVKQCQEEDLVDRRQDMSDLRQMMSVMTNNNQAMMDLMLTSMQEMMSQMKTHVDSALSNSPSSSLSASSLGMTDAELNSIESKIEAMSSVGSSISTATTSSKKTAISLDDLRTINHSDVQYHTDSDKKSFIGGGTFGDVYRGSFKGQPVAVKVLKDNTAMAISALKKEAYAMQLLSACKHMILFHGVRVDSKPYYLVMELACCSLYDMLYDENCMYKISKESKENAASLLLRKMKILYDIVQGVYFLHSVRVIHRDIKPMNVMLSTLSGSGVSGGETIMKLSDFGSAQMKDIGASTNGLAKGTPAYMAPEITLADDPDSIEYTEASDIYAFGILMNEVLEHSKPFDGLKAIQIIRALDKGSRPKLFKSEEDLTATGDGFVFELQMLIDRCWHETTTKRPAALSVGKKLARLGGFKAMPSTAAPPSLSISGSSSAPPSPLKSSASPSPYTSQKATVTTPTVPTNPPAARSTSNSNPFAEDSEKAKPPPVPPKPVVTAAPVAPPAAPLAPPKPVVDLKAKEIADLLTHYNEAFRYYTDVRILYDFDKATTMTRLAWAKISKQSCFIAGFVLVSLSIPEIKLRLQLSANQIWSLGTFVFDDMQLILSTPHLKLHPQLSLWANYFLAIVVEEGYHSSDRSAKNVTKAFSHMKLAADGGYPLAQSSLGIMYDKGKGVAVNQTEAFACFRRAADANYIPAIHNAATCLEHGDGCKKNLPEAVRYYQRAVDGCYVSSMVNLALLYRNGEGVTKNHTKSFQLLQQGANKGCLCAQRHLGLCYQEGFGVAKNMTEAVRWFQQSATQGDLGAKQYLAACYDFGTGVPKDRRRSQALYQEAADAGDEEAIFVVKELALFEKAFRIFHRIRYEYEFAEFATLKSLFRSEGNVYAAGFHLSLIATSDVAVKQHLDIPSPYTDAKAILADALHHFEERSVFDNRRISSYSLYFLGVIYESGLGDVHKDVAKAYNQYYKVSAEKGFDLAQNSVGYCLCTGTGCDKSDELAFPWFQLAAAQGFSQAHHNVGYCYQYGLGVPMNYTTAVTNYRAAADQGHLGSTLNLGVMYEEGYGVPKDLARAVSLYRTAADKGEPQAQYNLAVCYEKGTGVSKDKSQAKRYYALAAAQNHADAKSKLEKCIIS